MYICNYIQIFHNEIVGKRAIAVETELDAYKLVNFWHAGDTNWKYVIIDVVPATNSQIMAPGEVLTENEIKYSPVKK